ncbi:enoyl-CoA delta isomerase 2, peroxisomal-like [Coffea eugenioides]|uniref:enoyl-CoA delta isomerase 2, peroxisomal-like n=1 Tax=Coffea eugenioides TaxID=49369 RepID=UPI000F6092BE|nr:enoyl-CoA delta isomerase 2, peroxisomal-like [Coffea eugenioides]
MCTLEKRGNIFLLTLTGDDEHRLNPTLIASIRSALAEVKSQATEGSVLITSGQGKFFSNGFDLRYAQAAGSVQGAKDRLMNMVQIFKPLVADLISLPMPTIAAITGHAAAAGLMLALSHDYITMRSDKGVLYMSELDIGMTLPDYFNAIFRSKIGLPSARRALLLRASKVRAEEAAGMGIIDSVHSNGMETLEAAVRLGEDLSKKKWEGKVYAEIRKSLYPELCGILGLKDEKVLPSRL